MRNARLAGDVDALQQRSNLLENSVSARKVGRPQAADVIVQRRLPYLRHVRGTRAAESTSSCPSATVRLFAYIGCHPLMLDRLLLEVREWCVCNTINIYVSGMLVLFVLLTTVNRLLLQHLANTSE